jgi:glycosyltransferase involved in cell wall biosynthesis
LYVFAENNSEDNTLERIWSFKRPHKVIRIWLRGDATFLCDTPYEPIAHIRQLLLKFARNYDPDYAIFLDSDIYPRTRELIDNLTLWNKDIVGGAYVRAFPEGIWLASKWSIPGNKNNFKLYRNVRMPLDEPAMTSAGCMCLSRRIIQDKRVNFFPMDIPTASEDFGYCLKAREIGYTIYLDGTVDLHHVIPARIPNKPWTFDPEQQQHVPFFYNLKEKKRIDPKQSWDPTSSSHSLRIGILSTRFLHTSNENHSGLEQLVTDLSFSLDKLGHEVTLFAPEGTAVPPHGRLVTTGSAIADFKVNWAKIEKEAYKIASDEMSKLDVLHGHTHYGFEYYAKTCNPQLNLIHTHHEYMSRSCGAWLSEFQKHVSLNLVAVSDWMKQVYAKQGLKSLRCYNGIDMEKYHFQKNKNGKAMFLGRIVRGKGPHLAIKAAREAHVELDVVGSTSLVHDSEYVREIKNLCDGKMINFVGEVNQEDKIEMLKNASCLLVPSCWGEPFGLVSLEAMACGTVPIALNDGALSEIIVDGQSGFLCNSIGEMSQKIKKMEYISPETCRKRAREFRAEKMASEYVNLYSGMMNGKTW